MTLITCKNCGHQWNMPIPMDYGNFLCKKCSPQNILGCAKIQQKPHIATIAAKQGLTGVGKINY